MTESLHVQDPEEDLPQSAKKPRIACGLCHVETSKYTCPKCELRTCSLACSAQHKTERNCDGVRPPFVPVQKFSQFNETTSVKDQEFLHTVQSKVYESKPATTVPPRVPRTASFVPQQRQEVSSPTKQEMGTTLLSPSVTSPVPHIAPPSAHVAQPSNSNEFSNLTPTEKYLLQNCHRRRVWLTVNSREEADGSRHEQFSDTVYWAIRMKFMRHAGTRITTPSAPPAPTGQDSESREDGELDSDAGEPELRIAQSDDEEATDGQQEAVPNQEDDVAPAAPIEPTETSVEIKQEPTAQEERDAEAVEEHSYTVKNIPESLTVNTLLRQFVRPKVYGPVISRGDLDADKMAPFIEAGMDHVSMYMRVPVGPNERYYIIDKTKTILENLRNRFVMGHPEFIVTLDNDFTELPTLSENEAQDLQTARREEYKQRMSEKRQHFGGGSDGPSASRGHGPPFRGGPSFSRGGGRGGGRGGFRGGRGGFGGDRNRFGGPGGPPRGGHFRGARGGGGGQPFHGGGRRAPPEVDPFEHFMDTNPRYLRPSDYAPPRNSESDEHHQ